MTDRNTLPSTIRNKSITDRLGQKYKQAKVVDMNFSTQIPRQQAQKKNKNDFYRFLLSANYDTADNFKINNDVFIPRSILKKNNAPGLIKEQRLEQAAEEFFEY
jgi:hypothetical protein